MVAALDILSEWIPETNDARHNLSCWRMLAKSENKKIPTGQCCPAQTVARWD